MTTMTAFEAKTHFGELLDQVAHGQEIVITRYDKPVARIVPEGERNSRETLAVVNGLMDLQRRIGRRTGKKATLTNAEVRAAIEEGRP